MHGSVGDLRGKLVVEQVERGEGGASKSGRDGASRRSTGNRSRSVGTLEPRPVFGSSQPSSPPIFHRSANRARTAREELCDGFERGCQLDQPREVARAAWSRQRPHILQPEVAGELVDPPGSGGVARCPGASFVNMHTVLALRRPARAARGDARHVGADGDRRGGRARRGSHAAPGVGHHHHHRRGSGSRATSSS
jgi:hypothetical protein